MMSKDFSAGDRPKVSADYHWAKDAIGTVMQPPDFIVNMSDGWEGIYGKVSSLKGMLTLIGLALMRARSMLTVMVRMLKPK